MGSIPITRSTSSTIPPLNNSDPKEKPAAVRTPLDRILDFLERFWKSRRDPEGVYQKTMMWVRRGVAVLNITYLVVLTLILLLLEFHGERNLTLCFLLFLPAQGWLTPLIALVPINLLLHPKWSLAVIPAFLMVFWLYLDWQWRTWEEATGPSLTVMTNNVGQNNRQSMRPFLNQEEPSIIVLQEAGRKGAFERDYP
ncbi:hypothetical protein N9B94_04230, partial [Verrucomicrobia bacterium]|nr:hypothetical protein [Verrucomicrobiota bacterium]